MGFVAQATLERTGLPVYNSAYRRGIDEQMPTEYLIYSQADTPEDFWDDRYNAMRHLVTVHLCSRGNPMEMAAKVLVEMAKDGLHPLPSQDAYDEDADLYIKVLRFSGTEEM